MTDPILEWIVVFLPTALGILGVLFSLRVNREGTQHAPSEAQAAEILVFQGVLIGPSSVNSAADYLEKLAKKLPS